MPRVTIKSLQQKIEDLKGINNFYGSEINRLYLEIDSLKDNENIVSKIEFEGITNQLEHQKQIADEYRKMYKNLDNRCKEEKNKLMEIVKKLQEELKTVDGKTNIRNAGRKAYSNDKVIKMIYNLYLNGKSLQLIADELNRSEIKTNRDKDWSKSSVRFILLNSKNVSNGFIEEDMFNSTVKLLKDRKK